MFKPDKAYQLEFPVRAKDWSNKITNYSLFAAISELVPALHQQNNVRIFTFGGTTYPPGRFRLRCPGYMVEQFSELEDQVVSLEHRLVKVLAPTVVPIQPSKRLSSKIVVIHPLVGDEQTRSEFEEQLDRALFKLKVQAKPSVGPQKFTMIKGNRVDGFEVVLNNLSDEDSITVQSVGVGGRGHMGCGIFEAQR